MKILKNESTFILKLLFLIIFFTSCTTYYYRDRTQVLTYNSSNKLNVSLENSKISIPELNIRNMKSDYFAGHFHLKDSHDNYQWVVKRVDIKKWDKSPSCDMGIVFLGLIPTYYVTTH